MTVNRDTLFLAAAEAATASALTGVLEAIAGLDQEEADLIENSPGAVEIIKRIGIFVDVSSNITMAYRQVIEGLEFRAQFTDVNALGDEELSTLQATAKTAGKENFIELLGLLDDDGKARAIELIGSMVAYTVALETKLGASV